jgi:carbonic anhydrase
LPATDPRFRFALIETAVYLNAAITAFDLAREMPAASRNKMPVYYGVCDLQTMLVSTAPCAKGITSPSLQLAPRVAQEFLDLGDHFAAEIAERDSLA